MTTYTTPHFATGVPDRSNVRPESAPNRARTASAAPYRTAGVTNEAALMSEGQTPDWQPGANKGVPKAAIGALGAALVGGVALAIVLMAPSNKVTKPVMPDPIAQAAGPAKSADGNADAAVNQMDKQPPAAGNRGAADATTSAAAPAAGAEPLAPAPVHATTTAAPPVADAPVAHATKSRAAPVATPRVAPQPVQSAPAATPDTTVTPPADVQQPAMQQTPDTPTVTPSTPAPAPTPDTPAPAPAPAP